MLSEPEESDSESSIEQPDNAFLQKYFTELQQFSSGVDEVQRRAVTGALRVSRLRSLAWAILLDVIPSEQEKWLPTIRKNREEYAKLKERVTCNPHFCKIPEDNPLSQNDESIWNQHFRDNDLRSTINLDVIRTFPGVEFFTLPKVRETMINVLFCFARETPSLLYRQGMHEILAPLIFVLQSDHQAVEHITVNEEITEIMDPKYIEHDSYALFKSIMTGIKKFYTVKEIAKLQMKPVHQNVKRRITDNEIIRYIGDETNNLLTQEDEALAEYLRKCDISLCIFGLRWMRLLFGREFPLHDLLLLWDAIFAFNDFSLTGYIMVAMLIAIRSLLMSSEPIVCLTNLMHYPASVDVQYIIEHALYLKYPEEYCKPVPRNFNLHLPKNTTVIHQRRIITNKNKNYIKKILEGENDPSSPNDKIGSAAGDSGIVDGLSLQEPTMLRDELYYIHGLMTICHRKIDQYEEVLRQTIPTSLPLSHPAYHALKGLKEVSDLLKNKRIALIIPEVEPALEAESANLPSKGKQKVTKPNNQTRGAVPNNPPKDVPLKLYKCIESDVSISGAPKLNPLGQHED